MLANVKEKQLNSVATGRSRTPRCRQLLPTIPYSVTSSEAGSVNVATQFPELTELEENVLRGLGLIRFADGFEIEGAVEGTNGDDNN